MLEPIRFTVLGTPVPQGSKRAFGGVLVDTNHKTLKPWRQEVAAACQEAANGRQLLGPVGLIVQFHFARPKSHYRTGKNAHLLRENAPEFVDKKPDIDKTLRAVMDAITIAGAWRDDAQVVATVMTKRYDEQPSLNVTIVHAESILGLYMDLDT